MNEHVSKLVAGLLALGVIGGVSGYLGGSLISASAKPMVAATHSSRTVRFAGKDCQPHSSCRVTQL